MRNETRKSGAQDQSTRTNAPVPMIKENMPQASGTTSLKNATLEERKKDAKNPIYLVRYE